MLRFWWSACRLVVALCGMLLALPWFLLGTLFVLPALLLAVVYLIAGETDTEGMTRGMDHIMSAWIAPLILAENLCNKIKVWESCT